MKKNTIIKAKTYNYTKGIKYIKKKQEQFLNKKKKLEKKIMFIHVLLFIKSSFLLGRNHEAKVSNLEGRVVLSRDNSKKRFSFY